MVLINSKYVDSNGTLDDGYTENYDGVAVLAFLFDVNHRALFKVALFSNRFYKIIKIILLKETFKKLHTFICYSLTYIIYIFFQDYEPLKVSIQRVS